MNAALVLATLFCGGKLKLNIEELCAVNDINLIKLKIRWHWERSIDFYTISIVVNVRLQCVANGTSTQDINLVTKMAMKKYFSVY